MSQNLMPVGDSDSEVEFTVNEGEKVGLLFRSGPSAKNGDSIIVEYKNSSDNYEPIGAISAGIGNNFKALYIAGDYRLNRATGVDAGVDRSPVPN